MNTRNSSEFTQSNNYNNNCDQNECETEERLVKVIADQVSAREIRFECPFCYKRLRKNGEPRKNGAHIVHVHHSGGDMNNRVVYKNPHCIQNYITGTSNFPKDKDGFLIEVTPQTKRLYGDFGIHRIDDLEKRKTESLMRQYYPNMIKCPQ